MEPINYLQIIDGRVLLMAIIVTLAWKWSRSHE
jgi:hypothetical protein